jgi:uncharacterized protein (DUF885 family)
MPKNFSAKDKEKYKILYQEAISSKIIPAYQKMGDFLEKEYLPKARNTDGINAIPNGKTSTNIMQNLGLLPIKLQKKLIKLVYNKLLC